MNHLLKIFLLVGALAYASSVLAAEVKPLQNLNILNSKSLSAFDGRNGHKGYVALNGYVYDVSNIPQWNGGKHYKGMVAGRDLTPNISKSPHGAGIIDELDLKPVARYQN